MATRGRDIVSDYDLLAGWLASTLSRYENADRIARIYLDRLLTVYALERMGALPTGSASGKMIKIEGLFTLQAIDGIDADTQFTIVGGIKQLFDRQDTVRAVCRLLDSSASFMCGDRARDGGVHYTPMAMAIYICKSAIDAHVDKWIGRRSSAVQFSDLSLEELYSVYFNLLKKMRVLDSSCGSGIFLEAALGVLYDLRMALLGLFIIKFLNEKRTIADDLKAVVNGDMQEYRLKKEIIENNLYGVDIEPYSVEIASFRLKLLLASCAPKPIDFKDIQVNLDCKNVLLVQQVTLEGDRFGDFDVIVGNPPYMRVKSMFSGSPDGARMKRDFAGAIQESRLYRYQEGNLNLYKLFIERNLLLLKKGGSMGLIFPASFLSEATSEKLRKHIFHACSVEEIVEIPERSKLFSGVNQATAILILNKTPPEKNNFTLRHGASLAGIDSEDGVTLIADAELEVLTDGRMEVPLLSNPSLEWDMIKMLKRFPTFRGDGIVPPIGTITVGSVDETIDKEFISEIPTGDILVKGIHLKEYAVDLSPDGAQPRWVKKAAFIKKRPSSVDILSQPRIIGRNTLNKACRRRLKFAQLPPGYVCSNSIKQIVITDRQIDPLYLLALLNSSTLNWYFELFNDQNNIRNYSIEALPIVRAPIDVQNTFIKVVGLLTSASGDTREYIDKRIIDPLVYEQYFHSDHRLLEAVQAQVDGHSIEQLLTDPTVAKYQGDIERNDQYKLIMKATYKIR